MSFNINSVIQSHTVILIGSSSYSTWTHQVHNLLTMATWWDIVSRTSTHAAQPDAMQHLQKNAYVTAGGVAHSSLVKDLWDQLAALYVPTGITSQYEAFSLLELLVPTRYRGNSERMN